MGRRRGYVVWPTRSWSDEERLMYEALDNQFYKYRGTGITNLMVIASRNIPIYIMSIANKYIFDIPELDATRIYFNETSLWKAVNMKNKYGNTAMHFLLTRTLEGVDNYQLFRFLVCANAYMEIPNHEGVTSMQLLNNVSDKRYIKFLLDWHLWNIPSDLFILIMSYLSYETINTYLSYPSIFFTRYFNEKNSQLWKELYYRDIGDKLPIYDDNNTIWIQYISGHCRMTEPEIRDYTVSTLIEMNRNKAAAYLLNTYFTSDTVREKVALSHSQYITRKQKAFNDAIAKGFKEVAKLILQIWQININETMCDAITNNNIEAILLLIELGFNDYNYAISITTKTDNKELPNLFSSLLPHIPSST